MGEATVKFDISELNLHYGEFHALKNINMKIDANQITAFIGPSGCGKSTLALLLASARGGNVLRLSKKHAVRFK